MSIRRSVCVLLATPVVGSIATAQLPAAAAPAVASPVPAVASPLTPAGSFIGPLSAAPAPVGIAPAPPPPGPATLGQFLGLSYQQREYRMRRMARTPLGKLREKIQKPLSKITGGIIPPFPPATPSLPELQAPGPVGAAAKVKLDRETAIDRIKAVEYLGSVDCHYWPEAEDALVGALRADRNEWVRLAAAQTLGKGCCCTKKTITALSMVVSCSMEDGNPIEKSPQVIAEAQAALSRCLAMACACQPSFDECELAPALAPVTPLNGDGQKKGEAEGEAVSQASYSKAGPAGSEKSAGGLAKSAMAQVSANDFYERVNNRPWGTIISTAKVAMANTPKVPAHVLLSGANRDLELSGYNPMADAVALSKRPANLLDMLLGEDIPEIKPAPISVNMDARTSTPMNGRMSPAMMATRPRTLPQTRPTVTVTHAPSVVSTHSSVGTPASPKTAGRPASAPSSVVAPAMFHPMPSSMTPPPNAFHGPAPVSHTLTSGSSSSKPVIPVTNRAMKLIDMTNKHAEAGAIKTEVDQLTATDFRSHTYLTTRMLQVAEDHPDPSVRAAAIRSFGRCGIHTPAVFSGLERLVNDRTVDVRVEAAVTLNALRSGK